MEIIRIEGATAVLGLDQGYIPLPVRKDKADDGTTVLVSSWKPSAEELERLNKGAPVYLAVYGSFHPPVRLDVPKFLNEKEG